LEAETVCATGGRALPGVKGAGLLPLLPGVVFSWRSGTKGVIINQSGYQQKEFLMEREREILREREREIVR
jgi:hypothetical protein